MIQQVETLKVREAAEESLREETPEEEFGLVGGTLGHVTDELMDEAFFNAALWENPVFQLTL